MHSDAIIVGGGAAGLLCAGFAARRGKNILLLERMERPGRKLLITGKGRCNLTNNCDSDSFFASVRTNPRFLYSAYAAFSAQDTMALLEELGVSLKTERGGRVFPRSDRSMDIVDALARFAGASARIERERVCGLLLEDGHVAGVRTESGRMITSESVVVATGGKSYPLTGSTGDGYVLAGQAGHTIAPQRPSLIPIVTEEKWPRDLMGLSLKNCTLRVRKGGGKPVFEELGEMLFTHFGISGPLVLSASAHMTGALSDYRVEIDLKPGLSEQQLDARLLRDFGENSNRDFINSLGALLPRKLIPVVVRLSGIEGDAKVHQISREQRKGLVRLLKALSLTPSAFRPIEEAVITAGGVKVGEVHPGTMQSKLVGGLYFAGEVLDLDAYTGGYNLQIAFSTGYLAAQSI